MPKFRGPEPLPPPDPDALLPLPPPSTGSYLRMVGYVFGTRRASTATLHVPVEALAHLTSHLATMGLRVWSVTAPGEVRALVHVDRPPVTPARGTPGAGASSAAPFAAREE